MWMQRLQVVFLALTPYERWGAAKGTAGTSYASESWLTGFAVAALSILAVLMLWVILRHRRTEKRLKLNISDLIATTFKLHRENDQMAAMIEELRREIAELSGNQVEVSEHIADVENAEEGNSSAEPQETDASSRSSRSGR